MVDDIFKKKLGKVDIYVVEGDITQIAANAILTAINSRGLWFGGIDGAIQRVAGDRYHSQAAAKMPLHNLQTIVAEGCASQHRGQFNDVVFVVDDLRSPLDEVIYAGLKTVNEKKYHTILVPTIRLGVMKGVVEKTPEETIDKMVKGLRDFTEEYGVQTRLDNVTFVVYQDRETVQLLKKNLRSHPRSN